MTVLSVKININIESCYLYGVLVLMDSTYVTDWHERWLIRCIYDFELAGMYVALADVIDIPLGPPITQSVEPAGDPELHTKLPER